MDETVRNLVNLKSGLKKESRLVNKHMPTKKTYFLQNVDSYSTEKTKNDIGQIDLHLSDYNFKKVKKLNISPLRWTTLVDGEFSPGRGYGTLIIGEHQFKVTYAWGGRHKPKGRWTDRTSYTVRLEGCGKAIEEINNNIIIDESGSLKREVPFREHYKSLKSLGYSGKEINSPQDYRNSLLQLRAEIIEINKDFTSPFMPANLRSMSAVDEFIKRPLKPMSIKKIKKAVEKFTKQWNDPKATVTLYNSLKNIETDML